MNPRFSGDHKFTSQARSGPKLEVRGPQKIISPHFAYFISRVGNARESKQPGTGPATHGLRGQGRGRDDFVHGTICRLFFKEKLRFHFFFRYRTSFSNFPNILLKVRQTYIMTRVYDT